MKARCYEGEWHKDGPNMVSGHDIHASTGRVGEDIVDVEGLRVRDDRAGHVCHRDND